MMRTAAVCCLLLCCLIACKPENKATTGGDAARGKQLVAQYGCTACHQIPGVAGPRGMVGPPLDGLGGRSVIAGSFPNTPENMERWLQNPQAMAPNSSMPNVGVTPRDAKDMTAFLYTLK